MADSDKNIVITPNISSSSDNPKIVFSGADASTAAQDITLYTYPTSSGTLSFEGSAGQLFSITNDLTGTIFSVNDVSGIPSIEVDADGTIRLAEFGGNVLLGTATDDGTNLLQVDGSVLATTFSGALSGNATTATTLQTSRTIALGGVLSGSASFDGSSNITITAAHTSDPVITLTGAVTGTGTMTNLGNVSIATTATSDPIITLTGAVTGTGTMTNLGNVSIATTNTADPTLTLAGDATGSATFTNLGNATLTVAVADDSHNHIISNVDGLQTALDAKLNLSGGTLTGDLTVNGDITNQNDAITKARMMGWVPAYSNSNETTVKWDTDEAAIALGPVSQGGMAFKAIRMKSGDTVRLQVQIKGSTADTDGVYVRIYYYNGDLPDGKTHVSNSATYSLVQEETSGDNGWYENSAITTSWVGFERTYTAPADGYMSLVILNWAGYAGTLYVKQPDIQFQNVYNATTLQTARTINGVSFDGSANITVTANTPNTLTRGTYLTGSNFNGSAATTWAVDATTAATASKVVARDGNGYVFASYYNSAGTFSTTGVTSGMARFTGTNGTDTYGRSYTAAAAAALLSGSTMDIAGNATTATTLATARTINGVSFDGSANITVADATKLPLTGGTISGSLTIGAGVTLAESTDRSDLLQITSNTSGYGGLQIRNSSNEGRWSFMTDGESAGLYNDEDNQWHILMSEAAGVNLYYSALTRLATTATGVTIWGTATATTFSGALSGNATTATTLETARTINGVSFDGSANITVADATKLPLTGGTLTGDLTVDTDITAGSTSKTSDTVIRVQAGDANSAGFIANGSAQGTAYFEWSQNSAGTVGGGVVYNGDGSPAFGASEVTDRTTFYRMQFGRIKVFDYPYNSNTVTFYGDTTADGTVTSSTSFRAPIFYDTNNTAYYIDPASTGTAGKFNGTVICKNVDEGVYSNTGTTLNPNLGAIQFKTLTANTTFTDSVDSGESMTLRLDGGATYTVTWPTMTWITSGGNVAPTLNGTKDVIVLWKEGTTLYGAYAGYGA